VGIPSAVRERRRPEEAILYRLVQGQWNTFVQRLEAGERVVPRFCIREVEASLRCGILAHGFARVICDACKKEEVVAFSCKGRGFCPSCGTRRMVDTAAWLVDRVLPAVQGRAALGERAGERDQRVGRGTRNEPFDPTANAAGITTSNYNRTLIGN